MIKAKISGLLAALVLLASFSATARAADEAKASASPKAYIVLVGISNYADKQINPRPHAVEDVQALYDLFTKPQFLGVDKDHIRLLLGGSEDAARSSQPATHENILKAIKWVAAEAKPDDLVIFTFIGQGGTLGEKGDRLCYFASDSTVKDRQKNAVAAAEIGQDLEKLKSQKFCAFLDVNFKGFTPETGSAAQPTLGEAPYKEFLGDDGTEDHLAHPGRALFLATNGLSQSLDLKDHGLFTQVLLDGLSGKADKEGYEPDGVITTDELTAYMNKEITDLANKFGKTKEEKRQDHFVLGGLRSHFVLTKNPEVTAKVQERLEKFTKLSKEDKKIDAKLAEEGQQLLSRMPKLESQRSLRKEYQKLVDGTLTTDKFLAAREEILDNTKLKRETAESFAEKVLEAAKMITDNYVKPVNLGEMIGWSIRGLYRRIDEKLPEELKGRLDRAKTLGAGDLKNLLADAREQLGKREDLDNHKDIDHALQQMLRHLDPYTTYIDPETLSRFKIDTQAQFIGVGIQIRKDITTDMLQVITPIKDSPAYKKGIQAGDLITTITRTVDDEGKKLLQPEVISTKGLSTNDAVKKILGKANTPIKLTVTREGETNPIDFEITRNKVEVETVLGIKRKSDDTWDYFVDPDSKVGYIRLTSFARNSFRDMAKVMKDLKKQGLKGLVLDLRFDPGGLLDSACDISDLFIEDGVIVTIKPRVGKPHAFKGKAKESGTGYSNFPMVCLVNGGSASGSEIVSACLQDQHRAVIMGERSYGKGSVQNIQDFEGGQLKLTTASFWRPNGKNLNKSSTKGGEEDEWGVTPDKGFLIKLSPKEREDLAEYQHNLEIIDHRAPKETKPEFKDKQLDTAIDYLKGQIKTASRLPSKKAG
jgi:carboxyl-terminal processing protease